MTTHNALSKELRDGIAADIWYDAAHHSDDSAAARIEATQAAMAEAATLLDVFDPGLVRVEAVRFSETQGEAKLFYGDELLGQFGDTYWLDETGKWQGRALSYWQAVAEARVAPRFARYNAVQVEAALCIWEELLARYNQADGQPWAAPMIALWEAVGTGQMRNLVARVAPAVEAFYSALLAERGESLRLCFPSYDFDFIPAVCQGLDWHGDMKTACYMPQPIALPDSMRAHIDFVIWRNVATVAAGRLWGYLGLVDDDPDALRAAFDAGEDAVAYIKQLGEGLDLAEPDPYTAAELAKRHPE